METYFATIHTKVIRPSDRSFERAKVAIGDLKITVRSCQLHPVSDRKLALDLAVRGDSSSREGS